MFVILREILPKVYIHVACNERYVLSYILYADALPPQEKTPPKGGLAAPYRSRHRLERDLLRMTQRVRQQKRSVMECHYVN
jgi:hypothetical protein